MTIHTQVYTFHRPEGMIDTKNFGGRVYLTGLASTRHGFVTVYSQQNTDWTHLDFIWQGVLYRWTADRFFSKRYLVTLAARFAEEIVSGG